MKDIFLDTEFLEDGRTIDLISIAMVSGDKSLYLISAEFDFERARKHPFVGAHVLPQLPPRGAWVPRSQIRDEVLKFVGDGKKLRFWADCGAYDQVALAQLFGDMGKWPDGWPYHFNDIRPIVDRLGWDYEADPAVQKLCTVDGGMHDALYDAALLQAAFLYLKQKGLS